MNEVTKQIRPIQDHDDYQAMVALVDEIIDAEPGTDDHDTLQIASDLVWAWEQKHVEIAPPDPIEAIKFRLEQLGLGLRDLRPYVGSDARVSEVMSGKRALTLKIVRALHQHLRIPLESLVRERTVDLEEDPEVGKYPIAEMIKLGWMKPDFVDPRAGQEKEAWNWLRRESRAEEFQFQPVLCRENSNSYANAKTDPHSLYAWCLYVRAQAYQAKPPSRTGPAKSTRGFSASLPDSARSRTVQSARKRN